MKRKLSLIILVIFLVSILVGCSGKDKEILDLAEKGDIDGAIAKIEEYYKDDPEKQIELLEKLKSYIDMSQVSIPANSDTSKLVNPLEIQPGWTWEGDGYNYAHVKGRVKNVSDRNITYFEVTAEFADDAGNILNTDYTNSGETIRPGNMKEFDIMHEMNSDYKKVRIFVNDFTYE